MNLIFCGTPQFAVPTLEKLLARRFAVELVVTNPDKPRGRSHEPQAPPVKRVAERAGLEVYQPGKLTEPAALSFLTRFRPDAVVVVAYGHLIPQWMIDLPRLGCINLHASLLPKYRGAAPIQWALIRGETVTGATTMKIDAGLDTGDILLQQAVPILPTDTTETLSERLSTLGADLIAETIDRLERGDLRALPQRHEEATRAPMLKKEDGWIDWSKTAEEIGRRVRGLRPWPGAYTGFRGLLLHIWAAAPASTPRPGAPEPGSLSVEEGRLFAACGEQTALELKELQFEGRKRVSANDFLNGARLEPGERLSAEMRIPTGKGSASEG